MKSCYYYFYFFNFNYNHTYMIHVSSYLLLSGYIHGVVCVRVYIYMYIIWMDGYILREKLCQLALAFY